ncbi:MAG: hypothetical protein KAF91_26665 [Nostoc sp. TH1S01]|nr:hypothetical protein [Nostoc sp. TH1S01]
MQESVTYQALMNEGRAEGRAMGIEEGVRLVALNLLREGVADEVVIKVTGLSAENIQQLKLTELDSENRG